MSCSEIGSYSEGRCTSRRSQTPINSRALAICSSVSCGEAWSPLSSLGALFSDFTSDFASFDILLPSRILLWVNDEIPQRYNLAANLHAILHERLHGSRGQRRLAAYL